jgi:hypothetical protein
VSLNEQKQRIAATNAWRRVKAPAFTSARVMFTYSAGGFEMSSAGSEIEEVQRFFSDIETKAAEMAGLIAELRRKVEAQNLALEEFEQNPANKS